MAMPKGKNQKFKFTYLMKIMLSKTDEEHGLTMNQILDELAKYDISAERKSIYADFQDMGDEFGVEIIKNQSGRETYYHAAGREFELAEVKLLIDAIQSSKFITQKKSRELISKIKSFVSDYQATQLQRQVYITDRVKSMNESVYYNVDDLHTAINRNRKISFRYYRWNIEGKLVPKHNGKDIVVSPWALTWDDENYYLVAYEETEKLIKHYRVDKMKKLKILDEERAGKELFDDFDMARYSKQTFGMYAGELAKVRMRLDNEICGAFIDRFGPDIMFTPVDPQHSEILVDVNVSPQFFGWVFGLSNYVTVIGPENVVEELRAYTREFVEKMG